MTPDALKLASLKLERDKLKEEARHNVVQENAALSTAKAKVGEAAAKSAGTIAALIGRNDPNWEVPPEEILRLPGSVAWDVIRSKEREVCLSVDSYALIARDPVMMTYDFHFMTGQTTRGYDLDIALSNLFTILVGTNQSSVNWTKADLAQYIFCASTMYVAVNVIERNVALLERPLDYLSASPRAILAAVTGAGLAHPEVVDYYQANISDLKSTIAYVKNFLVTNLPLPRGLNVVSRWLWLTKWIFMDEVNSKPRLHACNPKEIHIPAANDAHYITTTDALEFNSTDPGTILANIMEKASRVMNLAAFKSVTSYIFKAVNEKHTLETLPFDADLDATGTYDPYTYDEEFLLQLVNMRICPDVKTGILNQLGLKYSGDDIARVGQGAYLSTGALNGFIYVETSSVQSSAMTFEPYITGFQDRPLSIEEVFMATRFQYSCDEYSSSYTYYYYDPSSHELTSGTLTAAENNSLFPIAMYGTELFVQARIWQIPNNANRDVLTTAYTLDRPMFSSTAVAIDGLTHIQRFDHHIQVIVYNDDADAYYAFGDIDWIMKVGRDQFANIQRNALTQLWGYTVSVRPAGSAASGSSRSPKHNGGRHRNKGKRGKSPDGKDPGQGDAK